MVWGYTIFLREVSFKEFRGSVQKRVEEAAPPNVSRPSSQLSGDRKSSSIRTSSSTGSSCNSQDSSKKELMEMLTCPLCLNLISEPISLACGHSFCRVCLCHALQRSKKKCPNCRAMYARVRVFVRVVRVGFLILSVNLHAANIMLANVARRTFPELYKERQNEAKKDMSTFESTLPIFFYNNVLFPGSLLHLHLFEQRYRHMINRCISSNRKFIYLPNFSDYKASEGDLGLMAHVDECEFLPDGRALLKATLQDRVKVTKSWVEEGTQGLAYCTFTPYEEENKAVDEQELKATVQLSNAFLEKVPGLCQQIAHHIGEQPDPSSEPMRWSFWFAALVTTFSRMGHRAVVLLQETKTCERLKMAKKIFTSIVARSFTNSQQQQQEEGGGGSGQEQPSQTSSSGNAADGGGSSSNEGARSSST
eukprot:jgi/Bigna1/77332/fgenesh1_pg.47_\